MLIHGLGDRNDRSPPGLPRGPRGGRVGSASAVRQRHSFAGLHVPQRDFGPRIDVNAVRQETAGTRVADVADVPVGYDKCRLVARLEVVLPRLSELTMLVGGIDQVLIVREEGKRGVRNIAIVLGDQYGLRIVCVQVDDVDVGVGAGAWLVQR